MGFRAIEPYSENPIADVRHYELAL
jgi:hypothetical protein